MATKSTNIRIDEAVKAEATALFARFGLTLADGVNVFLRVAIEERGLPFDLKLRPTYSATTHVGRCEAIQQLFEIAEKHPIREKNYKFNREDTYERQSFRR